MHNATHYKERADKYADEINNLRNVIQSACIGGMPAMVKRWAELFPDAGPLPDVSPGPAGILHVDDQAEELWVTWNGGHLTGAGDYYVFPVPKI